MDLIHTNFLAGELSPKMTGRSDLPVYPQGARTEENMLTKPAGGAMRRPGLEIIRESVVTPGTPETPAVPGTYTLTYLSQTNLIYCVPLGDRVLLGTLDAGGVANNVGGGIVGLPYTGHPFAVGQTINIAGTTNYDGSFVLDAGTTANELQISAGYTAEAFDGTEVVVRQIALGIANGGRVALDDNGNFIYGHNRSADNCFTMIAPDETTSTPLTWPVGVIGGASSGLAPIFDATYEHLYVLLTGGGYVVKFNWPAGTSDWNTSAALVGGYEFAIDASGNAYAFANAGSVVKLAAADGSATTLTNMGISPAPGTILSVINLEMAVDDTLGIVIAGGGMYWFAGTDPAITALAYNLCVRMFDNSAGGTLLVGTNYIDGLLEKTQSINTGQITTDGAYIYVLIQDTTTSSSIHKIQWDGSSLTEIRSWAGPTYGTGIFVDLWGNIVVVNQEGGGSQTTLFYYYDSVGTALGTITGMPLSMLNTWNSVTYLQGDVMFNGYLETPAVPGTAAVTTTLPVEL